jgi:uncharacterized protein
VVVAIFRSLEGESLEDYSIRLAERWRIGQKGLDNGVILLVFVAERQVRLEVGYGLEPVIPDAVAGQIIREALVPRFREGRYAAGLEEAVREVYARLGPGGEHRRAERGAPRLVLVSIAFMALVILFMIITAMRGAMREVRSGRRGYTGGRGGWSVPPISSGWGGAGSSGGGGGFSGGGGSFGGGGASGRW